MLYRVYNFLLETTIRLKFRQVAIESDNEQIAKWKLIFDDSLQQEFLQEKEFDSAPFVRSGNVILVSWGNRMIYKIENDSIFVYKSAIADEIEITLSLNYICAIIARSLSMLPIHCCSLESPKGGAYAFMGKSTVGKSTLCGTLLSEGWKMISEEMTICEQRNGIFFVTPGPPYIRLSINSIRLLQERGCSFRTIFSDECKRLVWDDSWKQASTSIELKKIITLQSNSEAESVTELHISNCMDKFIENVYAADSLQKKDYRNCLSIMGRICSCVPFVQYAFPLYPVLGTVESFCNK